jgi:hypothetical protein
MYRALTSAVIAMLFAAGAGIGVAGLGGFPPEAAIHWADVLEDHSCVSYCADWVFALVLAGVSYWRGLSDA